MKSKHIRSVSDAFKAMVALSICAVCVAYAVPEKPPFSEPILIDNDFVEPERLKAEAIDAAYASSLLQRDLLNELLLGRKLNANEAACMDVENLERGSDDTTEQLKNLKDERRVKQEVFYRCRLPEAPFIQHHSSNAIRMTFRAHLQARRALEESKAHARGCLRWSLQKEKFQQCMVLDPVLASHEVAWPGWMKLFERYRQPQ